MSSHHITLSTVQDYMQNLILKQNAFFVQQANDVMDHSLETINPAEIIQTFHEVLTSPHDVIPNRILLAIALDITPILTSDLAFYVSRQGIPEKITLSSLTSETPHLNTITGYLTEFLQYSCEPLGKFFMTLKTLFPDCSPISASRILSPGTPVNLPQYPKQTDSLQNSWRFVIYIDYPIDRRGLLEFCLNA